MALVNVELVFVKLFNCELLAEKLFTPRLLIVELEIVVEASVVEPELNMFVEVKLETEKLVEVLFVVVELIEIKFTEFDVDALVVEAFEVRKLDVVPHNVVMVARVAVKELIVAWAKVAIDENRFVEEAVSEKL